MKKITLFIMALLQQAGRSVGKIPYRVLGTSFSGLLGSIDKVGKPQQV